MIQIVNKVKEKIETKVRVYLNMDLSTDHIGSEESYLNLSVFFLFVLALPTPTVLANVKYMLSRGLFSFVLPCFYGNLSFGGVEQRAMSSALLN